MIMASHSFEGYSCIRCHAGLIPSANTELICPNCHYHYPIVGRIPVITVRPKALLATLHQTSLEVRSNFLKLQSNLNKLPRTKEAAGCASRAECLLNGMAKNIALVEKYLQPIAEYINVQGELQLDSVDWVSVLNSGWSPHLMLPYFYQDWGGVENFSRVQALIMDGLKQYCSDMDVAAILGAGACGLVKASAKHFRIAYGVDLSMPTLLIAKGLLSGDTLTVHLEGAEWREVRLSLSEYAQHDIRLVAANVSALPFDDRSMSAVVTQYLMDIVGNPFAVFAEIQRVLKDDGIWVNFSNPFRVPGEAVELVRPRLSELPNMLEPFGLRVVESDRQRFTLLDVEDIYPGGNRNEEEVHYFVARKSSPALAIEHQKKGLKSSSWFEQIPSIVQGREVQILTRQVFTSTGVQAGIEIGAGLESVPVAQELVAFVECLFNQIDGTRTLRDICDALLSTGMVLNEAQFYELFDLLLNHHGVLRTDSSI